MRETFLKISFISTLIFSFLGSAFQDSMSWFNTVSLGIAVVNFFLFFFLIFQKKDKRNW